MDGQAQAQIAELRGQLADLRAAIGAVTPAQAPVVMKQLVTTLRAIDARVTALETWAQTVTPPFTPSPQIG